MKKLLFFISLVGLVGCAKGSIRNDNPDPVKIAGKTIEPGQCGYFSGGIFGMGNKWPLELKGGMAAANPEAMEEGKLKYGDYILAGNTLTDNPEGKCQAIEAPAQAGPDGPDGPGSESQPQPQVPDAETPPM